MISSSRKDANRVETRKERFGPSQPKARSEVNPQIPLKNYDTGRYTNDHIVIQG